MSCNNGGSQYLSNISERSFIYILKKVCLVHFPSKTSNTVSSLSVVTVVLSTTIIVFNP